MLLFNLHKMILSKTRKKNYILSRLFFLLCCVVMKAHAIDPDVASGLPSLQSKFVQHGQYDTIYPGVIDTSHYSTVFGEVRNYRIYLPPAYYKQPLKRFPVIYFLHGWAQRYFGAVGVEYANFDSGDDNGGDNIENFSKRHDVIIVKMDGYDRSPNEKYYVRPYSIGPVEKSFRQFPIYFPELVGEIDEQYRTIPDRNHRAISGLSMGGFMSFWIAGKYPQMISVAGNFCGSTEFEVGPIDFPVEYKHLDMSKNYDGINIRLHYGDKDFIRSYHEDLNRSWMGVVENYSFKQYHSHHATCGLDDMFTYIMHSFNYPPKVPENWNHIDLYPDFAVWDYKISSNRDMPGFTILENVNKEGFKVSVREFLPDGALMQQVKLNIVSPGIYHKNTAYQIKDVDMANGKIAQQIIKTDQDGKLKISLNGSAHQVSISGVDFKPNLVLASYKITNAGWAVANKKLMIAVELLNKGFGVAGNVKATISSNNKNVYFQKNTIDFNSIKTNGIVKGDQSFECIIRSDSSDLIKCKLRMVDEKGNVWMDNFEVPIKKETNINPVVAIADGKFFTVSKAGVDSENVFLGMGNGDGIANPGESIVILVKDKNIYRRTNLFSNDPYVNAFGENARQSDNWGDYDHGGASSKYSIPIIAADCPQNHVIAFYGEYWLPGNKPDHVIEGARIEVNVKGQDKTAPLIIWGRSSANNLFKVKLADGAKIKSVKVTFTPFFDEVEEFLGAGIMAQLTPFTFELFDAGTNGDEYPSDNVFSCKIPANRFCLYKVIVEAIDGFGNKANQKLGNTILLH
jgi:S-formylglutathione hydrolase FrmB